MSRTEELELKVVEKYNAFDPSKDDVLELWADLDQLDYPKRLLTIVPQRLFHPDVMARAEGGAELAKELVRCLEALPGWGLQRGPPGSKPGAREPRSAA